MYGMFMKGTTFGTEPFIQTDPKTLKVIGGAALNIYDTIAEYYEFDYSVKYATNWYEFNEVGALVGGAAGDVSSKNMHWCNMHSTVQYN